jgi:IS6 family transposase
VTNDGTTQLGGGVSVAAGAVSASRDARDQRFRRAFRDDIIVPAGRWYVGHRLSYAEVSDWLAERGILVDQSTISRWVQRFLPQFGEREGSGAAPTCTRGGPAGEA